MSQEQEWHFISVFDQKQFGPYTWEQIQGFVSSAAITRDTLLWNETLTGWKLACDVEGLFDDAPRLITGAAAQAARPLQPPLFYQSAGLQRSSTSGTELMIPSWVLIGLGAIVCLFILLIAAGEDDLGIIFGIFVIPAAALACILASIGLVLAVSAKAQGARQGGTWAIASAIGLLVLTVVAAGLALQ